MRFVHTADWQVGMRATHVGSAGIRVREERLRAAQRVVEVANDADADFLLLTGDTFEDNGVDRVLVQRVTDTLSRFRGPVYVLPGNHDPLVPGSVWDHPSWRDATNLHVLRDEAPLPVKDGVLLPCPARSKHSRQDPTAWIKHHRDEHTAGVRVVVAHGTVESALVDEQEFPIARDTATRTHADYVALGHWHSTATYPARDGTIRMAYAGTHEPTRFGERDSGNVLVVQIDERGAPPLLTRIETGALQWVSLHAQVRAPGDLPRLRADIEALSHPEHTLLEVTMEGLLAAVDHDEMLRVAEIVEARFLYGRVRSSALRPAPTDDAWIAALPAGAVREAAARLRALSDPEYAGERAANASPGTAAWALLELYELLAEGSR